MARNGGDGARALSQEFSAITQESSKVSNKFIYGMTRKGLRARRSLLNLLSSSYASPNKTLVRTKSRASQPDNSSKTVITEATLPQSASFSGTPSRFRNWSISVRESSVKRLTRFSKTNLRKVRSLDWMREVDSRAKECSPPPPPSPADTSSEALHSPIIPAREKPSLTLDLPALDLDIDVESRLAYGSSKVHSSPVSVPNADQSLAAANERGRQLFESNPFIVGSVQKETSPFDELGAIERKGLRHKSRTERLSMVVAGSPRHLDAEPLPSPMPGSTLAMDEAYFDAIFHTDNRTLSPRSMFTPKGLQPCKKHKDIPPLGLPPAAISHGHRELPLAQSPATRNSPDGINHHRRRKSSGGTKLVSSAMTSPLRVSTSNHTDPRFHGHMTDSRHSSPRTPMNLRQHRVTSTGDSEDHDLVPNYIHTFRDLQGISDTVGRTPPFPRVQGYDHRHNEVSPRQQTSAEFKRSANSTDVETFPAKRVNSVSTNSMLEFVHMSNNWLTSNISESTENLNAPKLGHQDNIAFCTTEVDVIVETKSEVTIQDFNVATDQEPTTTATVSTMNTLLTQVVDSTSEDCKSECSTVIQASTTEQDVEINSCAVTQERKGEDASDSDSMYSDTNEALEIFSKNTYVERANESAIRSTEDQACLAKCQRLVKELETSLASAAISQSCDALPEDRDSSALSRDSTLKVSCSERINMYTVEVGIRGGGGDDADIQSTTGDDAASEDMVKTAKGASDQRDVADSREGHKRDASNQLQADRGKLRDIINKHKPSNPVLTPSQLSEARAAFDGYREEMDEANTSDYTPDMLKIFYEKHQEQEKRKAEVTSKCRELTPAEQRQLKEEINQGDGPIFRAFCEGVGVQPKAGRLAVELMEVPVITDPGTGRAIIPRGPPAVGPYSDVELYGGSPDQEDGSQKAGVKSEKGDEHKGASVNQTTENKTGVDQAWKSHDRPRSPASSVMGPPTIAPRGSINISPGPARPDTPSSTGTSPLPNTTLPKPSPGGVNESEESKEENTPPSPSKFPSPWQ